MEFLQGNQGFVPVRIRDCAGAVLSDRDVVRVQFLFGKMKKMYDPEKGGEVVYDADRLAFLVPVTEDETFEFEEGGMPFQVRVKFANGDIDGSLPRKKVVYASITKKNIGD